MSAHHCVSAGRKLWKFLIPKATLTALMFQDAVRGFSSGIGTYIIVKCQGCGRAKLANCIIESL